MIIKNTLYIFQFYIFLKVMIIKVSSLSNGKHEFSFEKNVKELKLKQPFIDDLLLKCKIDKSDHQIILNCELAVKANFICDRCTAGFSESLHSDFQLVYFFDKESVDEKDLNIRYLPKAKTEIDLTNDAFEYAQFSVPLKKLCDENCKGLCVSCGKNLNEETCNCTTDEINPVWEKLLELKDKLN